MRVYFVLQTTCPRIYRQIRYEYANTHTQTNAFVGCSVETAREKEKNRGSMRHNDVTCDERSLHFGIINASPTNTHTHSYYFSDSRVCLHGAGGKRVVRVCVVRWVVCGVTGENACCAVATLVDWGRSRVVG